MQTLPPRPPPPKIVTPPSTREQQHLEREREKERGGEREREREMEQMGLQPLQSVSTVPGDSERQCALSSLPTGRTPN